MNSSNFAFFPRKLAKKAGNSTGEALVTSTLPVSKPSTAATSEQDNGQSYRTFEDDKQPGTSKLRKEQALLEDSDYANLLVLALSDHALWSNNELIELINASDEGFISFRQLLSISPTLSTLDFIPPESTFIRCLKDNKFLERRMIVAIHDAEEGGIEIRRRDWHRVKERLRLYTSFQWERRAVYVENLPLSERTIQSVFRFLKTLLKDRIQYEDQPLLESIDFPRHRDDPMDGPPPSRCRGFAFVIFSRADDAQYICEQYPWRAYEPNNVSNERAVGLSSFQDSGFRCMAKNTWKKLKEDYLARQHQLFDEAATENNAHPRRLSQSRASLKQHPPDASRSESVFRTEENGVPSMSVRPPQLQTYTSTIAFPENCLIFVKNVHPETNKTTLKALFSAALKGKADAIDYVDYNKGLDSCYLRLGSSLHARALVDHYSIHKIKQNDGLDSMGSPGASSGVIEVELVQGRKEEMYWERVPEKVRRQALERFPVEKQRLSPAASDKTLDVNSSNGRKQKRRKRD